MLIDVILPTFNRAYCLDRSIASVLAQTHQHLKLFIIDDGSTDETRDVIQKYLSDPRVHYLVKTNQGVSAARNYGIRQAQAEWIALIDSDDEWLPQKLQTQVSFIHQNPTYNFVHSNEIWIRSGVRVNAPKRFDKSNHDIFQRSLEHCLISPSTVLMKKALCEQHGLFNEEFIVCEDYDLWLKILATEDVGFIEQFLIKKHGGHADQLSTKYPAMDYWRIRSMVNLLEQEPSLDEHKKLLLKGEISKKAGILLAGYLKHQNLDAHFELTEILKRIS